MFVDATAGFALGLSLIVAIGAQNAFVLRQGLRREHVLAVCMTCAVSDAILIEFGVGGLGWVIERSDWIAPVFRAGGAVFLFIYGCIHGWKAIVAKESMHTSGQDATTLRSTILTCLALTWLNPHVYLETVMLIGSISTSYNEPWVFGAGAIVASFMFFFTLGYGSRVLAGYFARPNAWRTLDALISVLMFTIAYDLAFG